MNRWGMSVTAVVAWLAWGATAAAEGELFRAMGDEMARSVGQLQLGEMDKPFFVSYLVREANEGVVAAQYGSVTSRSQATTRRLVVRVRVGSKDLDNTNFVASGPGGFSRAAFPASLPLEDDYGAIRRQIWLATDRAYKAALDQLAKKRAALQNRTVVEQVPDFSDQEANTYSQAGAESEPDFERLGETVRELSGVFRAAPEVSASEVVGFASAVRLNYLNSEGSSFSRFVSSSSVSVRAGTQAADGSVLEDSVTARAQSVDELPEGAELAGRARQLAARLARLREAPHMERYTGPVLFQRQAAAELVRQVLAPRLLATRMPVAADPRFERMIEQQANPFVDRIGARVLPRFLRIVDDPTLDEFNGVPLLGGYPVDFEGVPAGVTSLVERGFLKTLLATRSPVPGVLSSTGSHRGGGPAPSNLLIESSAGMAEAELLVELQAMAAERDLDYAIRVDRIGQPLGLIEAQSRGGRSRGRSPEGVQLRSLSAYRIYSDGREEPVSQAVLLGVSESAFRDIVAASADRYVHTAPFRSPGRFQQDLRFGQGPPLVSYVVPSLLFEDVTVRRPQGNIPRLPLVPQPAAVQ